MVMGNRILKRLGKEKFCAWLRKYGNKFKIDLQGAYLQGAYLQCANFSGANLQGAYLQCANLQYANLQGANLQGANLRGANLLGANLQCANFSGANLQGAKLQYANLQGANLRDAYLQGANLDFSCWPLWCGSVGVIIDEAFAKQRLAHAFKDALQFWPGELTKEQINWLNDFHRIKTDEFPKFE